MHAHSYVSISAQYDVISSQTSLIKHRVLRASHANMEVPNSFNSRRCNTQACQLDAHAVPASITGSTGEAMSVSVS